MKLKAEVRSPETARRHVVMLGSLTPKRCSMKRMSEVWSNTSELTQPPLLQGEIDDHRHAQAEAVGAGGIFGVARRRSRCVDVDGRAALGARVAAARAGRHVVEEAVVLVVGEEEGGLAPDFGVRRSARRGPARRTRRRSSPASSGARCRPRARRSTRPAAGCRCHVVA